MTIARKCDRCGTYHDGRIHVVTVTDQRNIMAAEEQTYDICHNCVTELEEFLKGAKPKSLLDRITYQKG